MQNNLDFEENFKKLPPSDDLLLGFILKAFSTSSRTRIILMLIVSVLAVFVNICITVLIKLYYMKSSFTLSMPIATFVVQLANTQPELSTLISFGITTLGIYIIAANLNSKIDLYLRKLNIYFSSILSNQHTAHPITLWISICKLLQSELTVLGIMVGVLISITTILGEVIFICDVFLGKYFAYISLFAFFSMFMLTLMPFFHLFTTLQVHLEHFLSTTPHLNQTVYVRSHDSHTIKLCITDIPPKRK